MVAYAMGSTNNLFGDFPAVHLYCSALLAVFAIYILLVYPILCHPLRKIPRAHWSVAFPYVGSLWIKCRRYQGSNNATTHYAHRIHGDVVRLGYEELSINCVDNGLRTVYGKGWEKADYYVKKFAAFGVTNMFTTLHSTPHSQKKRTIAHIYSKSYLHSSEQLMHNSVYILSRHVLPLLQFYSDSAQPVDVFDMNKAITMDFSSAYLFGLKQATNLIENQEMHSELMHYYNLRHVGEWYKTEVPLWLHWLMQALRMPLIPHEAAAANRWLENWTANKCEAADKHLLHQAGSHQITDDHVGNDPIVYRHFKTGMAELRNKDPAAGQDLLPSVLRTNSYLHSKEDLDLILRRELYSEMFDHLVAGHLTLTTSLTYLYWEMSRNPSIQSRLHAEIVRTLLPQLTWPLPHDDKTDNKFKLPDSRQIDSLPYLNAVVKEALRLHAPIPGHEPRTSPHVVGGNILGKFSGIPGGLTVSAMAHTLHRNEKVFPNPEDFDPDRWLTANEEQLKEMNRWFWPFGSGGRMCLGSNFALQAIKLFMAAIYTNWTTEIVNDEGIEKVDGYSTQPKGKRLILRFVHR